MVVFAALAGAGCNQGIERENESVVTRRHSGCDKSVGGCECIHHAATFVIVN